MDRQFHVKTGIFWGLLQVQTHQHKEEEQVPLSSAEVWIPLGHCQVRKTFDMEDFEFFPHFEPKHSNVGFLGQQNLDLSLAGSSFFRSGFSPLTCLSWPRLQTPSIGGSIKVSHEMLKKYLFLQESKAGLLGQAINGFLHFATFRFDLYIKSIPNPIISVGSRRERTRKVWPR